MVIVTTVDSSFPIICIGVTNVMSGSAIDASTIESKVDEAMILLGERDERKPTVCLYVENWDSVGMARRGLWIQVKTYSDTRVSMRSHQQA